MNNGPLEGTDDYAVEREHMLAKQIIRRGIADSRVLDAMRRVPRHLFVAPELRAEAYTDCPLGIACGQTISQPYMVALMTEMLALRPTDRVLEIGAGSGYQTAILAMLAHEVITVERHAALADQARQRLTAQGVDNVRFITGDGTLGHPPLAPYNAILVTAGAPDVPQALCDQLADGGRLVIPVGGNDVQFLLKITRNGACFKRESGTACRFVPLIGEQGWAS